MPPTVVFDANGTLFALDPVRELLGAAATEAFFERTLHSAAALTYAGVWAPFDEVARRALQTTCAKLDLDVDREAVLRALQELPPAPEAHASVEAAGDCAIRTNGGRDSTRKLVDRAGLPSCGSSPARTCGRTSRRAHRTSTRGRSSATAS